MAFVDSPLAIAQEPGTGQEPGDIDPRSALQDINAIKQKRQLLARNYVKLGDDAMNRGDFQGAASRFRHYSAGKRFFRSSR